MNKRWSIGLIVLLAFSLLASGCQDRPTAEEIVAHMQAVEASTENAHAVVELSGQIQGTDLELAIEMWEQRPNKFRAEVLEASESDLVGAVSVTDGQQVWMYHPGENEVVTGDVSALSEMDDAEILDPRQAIEFMDEAIQLVLDTCDVRLVGEEDLDGVATYVLEFTPKEEGEEAERPLPLQGTATLWVEQERWIVLQGHFEGGALGEGWARVRSFEFNAGVPDDRFQFEIPPDAEVIDVEDVQPRHLTLDEARAQAEFPLLVPTELPEGTTLVDVFTVEGDFILYYDHAETSFTVVQGSPQRMENLPSGETSEVTVRGQAATLIADGQGNHFLSWTEDGVAIIVAGRIDEDAILRVAESLQ